MIKKNFFLFLLILSVSSWGKPAKNIVLILADDLGWADTTLYGKTSLYETPNIERLAKRGMTFTDAYASPICSPTRASILTGQNPARHGMTSPAAHLPEVRFKPVAQPAGLPHQKSVNIKTATRIDPVVPTLSEILKEAGYATAHFGKWHLGMKGFTPLEHGFDVDLPHWHGPGPKTGYLAPWGYPNPAFPEGPPGQHIEDRMAKEAVTWLKSRDRTKPFFINYWQFSVHAPFGAKPELIERYRKKIKRGEKQQSPTYAAMVHSLDEAVGTLLDALDDEGVTNETIIVFYSDNGGNIHCGLEETDATGEEYITAITSNHPLRGGKGGIHEGGIRVPAVVVWPGVTKPGLRNDTRIQANDLYPTILEMLNLKHPKDHVIDGVDFSNALSGQKMERKPMFTFVPGHGNTPQWLPPSMAVHHGDWKFIRTFHYGKNGKHQYRLYNLRDDIGENHNVVRNHPERVKEMDQWITDYLVEANVVVPLPNPKFDPSKFDPATIGVQKGGLKMPPAKSRADQPSPVLTVRKKFMLGWVAKNADVISKDHTLRITATGRQLFLANAKIGVEGPVQVRLRIRTAKNGEGRLQWRTKDQEGFPETGQRKSFLINGGEWRELAVPLNVKGQLLHLRLVLPAQKEPIDIDWIEIRSADENVKATKRWDFNNSTPSPSVKPTKQPNVILILADDLGYGELGCYGAPNVMTPHMDLLAAHGVRCTDGYAAFPVCSPSRAALLTGRYPARFGPTYEDYYGGGAPELDPIKHPTIAQMMKDAGYRTGCFGKWNVSNLNRRPANDFGFDRWVGLHLNHDFYTHKVVRTGELDMYENGKKLKRAGIWSDTIFTNEAISFIKAESKKPFFIYLPFQAPHTPIQDPDVPMDKPQEKNRQTLIKMIERLDHEIGRILKALNDEKLVDNTLVILTSDNGGEQKIARNLPLSGAKQMLSEGGIRVPLILHWPAMLPAGQEFSMPISAMDLTATIATAAGVKPAPSKLFDGVDLVPALKGKLDLDYDRPLFFRRRNVSVREGLNAIRQSAVRKGDWKYLRTYRPVGSGKYQTALYNLKRDISEKKNVAAAYPEVVKGMSDLLGQWEHEMSKTAESFPEVLPRKKTRK